MRLPPQLERYFWDVDPAQVDTVQHPRYIQERLLDRGDVAAVQWLHKTFSDDELRKTLKRSRNLTRRSANYWALVLNVPTADIRCLNRPSPTKRDAIWPH